MTEFWKDKFSAVSPDKWAIYQGSLGNLLLLSQKINATLQDDDFDAKKNGKDDRNGYSHGSYSELKVSSNADWTPQEIEKRGKHMLTFMERRWNFIFESDEVKMSLLLPFK